ncbi:MAG: methylenetetrahydrofolate--tRNA-(uracil(54)-C(5))-methyltransferase (FADH(2)-oxidizing) TrmFO [Candidatus Krumholzibacteriota bacterium]|nr:methylenetetrahydrofolate--tRNA-(uracil(54)-C(5))-methyltransferase (FADH(2)-oxidizing) TrmFO [Candidatus Krumholzibacteriota bacterium]
MPEVSVIGGGLAGCEIALQLADAGIEVRLVEMRPQRMTSAHTTALLAEMVCSNSLKSEKPDTASGLLKAELKMLGCRLLELAASARVPAGHALAVDRELFSSLVTGEVEKNPRIRVERREQIDLDLPAVSVIAAGPLVSEKLARAIEDQLTGGRLFFYDAISLSISRESVDTQKIFKGSRYGKGSADYWNVPFSRDEYRRLVDFILQAPRMEPRDFEEVKMFEACLPVETIAGRGEDALRFGPLKPRGLPHPVSGREPYAVLQLRQETVDGSMLGLVGFQTRLTRKSQRELLQHIPGLEEAEILRWGSIHRNTFLDSPHWLDERQMSQRREGLFFSGQITGVEGYMESMAHGLVVAKNILHFLRREEAVIFPADTLLGSLQRYLSRETGNFQPMNANFGILPPVPGKRSERKRKRVERALGSMRSFLDH